MSVPFWEIHANLTSILRKNYICEITTTADKRNIGILCTYECTLLFLRRLLLLAFEYGGRGGLNPYQTGNKLSTVGVLL